MDETRVKDYVSEIKVHRIEDTFDHVVIFSKIRNATHKESTDFISKLSVQNFRKKIDHTEIMKNFMHSHTTPLLTCAKILTCRLNI